MGESFNVLMVCSGNLCRSPLAEQLLRVKAAGYPIYVSSAGLIAEDGRSMPVEAATVSRRHGGNPDGHRARLLTEAHLRSADLVLTATRAHRSSVVQLLPRMSSKTFTINEFVRLIEDLPWAQTDTLLDLPAMVSAARSRRGFIVPPEDPEDDDIEDPYRRPMENYEAVGALIDEQIALIAERLCPRGRCL